MMDLILPLRLKGYRFPRSVIAYAVWSYYRFNLSFRDVEDLLAERGVTVSYETIRAWVVRFGPQIAAQIRRDRPPAGDKWHIDEMVITIGGEPHWLWRAVNNRGDVLEIRHCQEFRVWAAVEHQAARALTKRSPKMTAN